jgi:hypothetical protein
MAGLPIQFEDTMQTTDITSVVVNNYSSYITPHTLNKVKVNHINNVVTVNIALYITTDIPNSVSGINISSYLPKNPNSVITFPVVGDAGVKGDITMDTSGYIKLVSLKDTTNILYATIVYIY